LNADAGEGVEMVRALQKLDKGINEKLREENEPMLLDGIKLDMDEVPEEEENVKIFFLHKLIQEGGRRRQICRSKKERSRKSERKIFILI